MHYTPHVDLAFNSVEHIMRDVNYGWLLRYLHANGASLFFFAVYIHIFRGLYYGSYKAPREMLWILGVIIFLLMMATAFMGYVAALGPDVLLGGDGHHQPVLGDPARRRARSRRWLWGGFAVDNPTLNRFFSLHYLLPFVIAGVVVLHIWALHVPGNGNPTGVEVKSKQDTVPFHPYYTIKDVFGLAVFLILFAWLVFFVPNYLGHPDNYIRPTRWRRRRTSCRNGTSCRSTRSCAPSRTSCSASSRCSASIAILVFLPWLDTSRVRSATFRPIYRQFFWIFVITCIGLGYLGSQPAEGGYVIAARILTVYYFAHFLSSCRSSACSSGRSRCRRASPKRCSPSNGRRSERPEPMKRAAIDRRLAAALAALRAARASAQEEAHEQPTPLPDP